MRAGAETTILHWEGGNIWGHGVGFPVTHLVLGLHGLCIEYVYIETLSPSEGGRRWGISCCNSAKQDTNEAFFFFFESIRLSPEESLRL